MAAYLLHEGAQVLCTHAAQARPTMPNMRVKVGGQNTVVKSTLYTISGCPFVPPPPSNIPCVTAQFITSALRVKSNGQYLLLYDSQAMANNGFPLQVVQTQTRVKGS